MQNDNLKNGSVDTIYISNLSEDVWQFISSISNPFDKSYEIEENAKLSDRDIFSFSGYKNVLCILPSAVDSNFLTYFRELTGNTSLKVLSTKIHTGEISKDIRHNRDQILDEIIGNLDKTKPVKLLSYSSTEQLFEFYDYIIKKGFNIVLPESPTEEDSWTVDFYGSKSGIRQLSQMSENDEPDFRMSEGLISSGIDNSAKIAAGIYLKNEGVVLKTNKGHSGAGILIFRPNDFPKDYDLIEKQIKNILLKERYWSQFPIIIEKYVDSNKSNGNSFPSLEFKINKSGKVDYLYPCIMRVSKEGIFKGVEIDNEILTDEIAAKIIDTGFYIGNKYAENGYRGYFDIDFIMDKSGELYVTESNVRRTGGTHVYHLAEHLFGKEFLYETYVLSNNIYQIGKKDINSFNKLRSYLTPILYNSKSKEGIVITSVSLLTQNRYGYVIFGKNKRKAYSIEEQMDNILK